MHLRRSLCTVLVLVALALPLAAQSRVTRDADVHSAPDGNVVAVVRSGTTWETGISRSGYTLVTLLGWVDASRFAGPRDSFPQSIGGSSTLRIRESPSLNGRILGEFRPLAGLRILERRGTWARVRRDAWVRSTALVRASATPARTPARIPARTPAAAPAAPGAPRDTAPAREAPAMLRAERMLHLRAAPTGDTIGRLEPGVAVSPVARDRGMVRVRVEAWVAESLLIPVDSGFAADLSAADLRLQPEEHKGRLVRWEVQVIALQKADGLRKDLGADESYLLAMGPGSENAVLYLPVPPSMMEEARSLPPLARVLITARVRNGRSQPTGVPVLDLISLTRR
jgi:hypothetical protein